MGRNLLGLLVGLAACYSPTAPLGAPCSADGACPTGLACIGGVCVSETAGADASPGDAGIDASSDGAAIDGPSPTARWSAGPDLPKARVLSCAVALDGFVFSIGGSDGELQTNVYRAKIEGSQLDAWAETTPIPVATRWHGCAVHPASRSIYVVGGTTVESSATPAVFRGVVTSAGDVTWTPQFSLLSPRRGASVVVVDDALFVLGGEEDDGLMLRGTVFAARITDTGELLRFTTTSSLPDEDYVMGAADNGTTLFLTGGYQGGTAVRSATPMGPVISGFTAARELDEPRQRHVAAVLGGWLYVTGGEPTFGGENLVSTQRAFITPDALGPWEPQPDLPEALAYAGGASTGESLYVVGGSNGMGASSHVYILTAAP